MPVLEPIRAAVNRALRARVAGPEADERAASIWLAPGPRRFAPEDPISRVHSHAAMYAGGIRALLLQSLHPLAMAGVAGHSGYRGDPWGRLQRTSLYIAMTTFGPEPSAERVLARVRGVHRQVRGHAPDGRLYRADDPHLLRWVHDAEIESFLSAYQWLAKEPLSPEQADAYVEQAGWAASKLGLPDPPRSTADLYADLASYRAELETSEAARDVAQFLLHEPPLPWAARPGYWMLAAGAVAMLPDWARRMLDLPESGRIDRFVLAPAGRLGTAVVGWALAEPADPRNAPQPSEVTARTQT